MVERESARNVVWIAVTKRTSMNAKDETSGGALGLVSSAASAFSQPIAS